MRCAAGSSPRAPMMWTVEPRSSILMVPAEDAVAIVGQSWRSDAVATALEAGYIIALNIASHRRLTIAQRA